MTRLNASRAGRPPPATRAAGSGKPGLSRITPPGGVLRRAQNPKGSHLANTPRAARLIATFHSTKLVRGWSMRVGEITGTILEFDMVRGFVLGTCEKWGVVKNGGLGLGGLLGGEKNRDTQMVSRQPKSGRQTSTRQGRNCCLDGKDNQMALSYATPYCWGSLRGQVARHSVQLTRQPSRGVSEGRGYTQKAKQAEKQAG